MKDMFGTISKIIVIVLAALLVCGGVMFTFDKGFNGAVGDWFKDNFNDMYTLTLDASYVYTETLNWPKLKSFITGFAISLVTLWTLTAIVFFVIGRKGNSKKIARETAKLIRDTHLDTLRTLQNNMVIVFPEMEAPGR